MWYEILPSFSIILVAMAVPHYAAYVLNKVVVGNPYRRSLETQSLRLGYVRDIRLRSDPYKVAGLEAIPDK